VHLVGFIIIIYRDARSPEHQKNIRLFLASFRRTIWLNRSQRQTSRQFLNICKCCSKTF